jgi:hypothetical protein
MAFSSPPYLASHPHCLSLRQSYAGRPPPSFYPPPGHASYFVIAMSKVQHMKKVHFCAMSIPLLTSSYTIREQESFAQAFQVLQDPT